MRTVAIIPARGGSRRIPGKNKRPFHGKPIIVYSIETALESKLFERVFVSTDDPLLGMIAAKAGASPVLRPHHLTLDHVGTQEVARNLLLTLPDVSYACVIYATAPLMTRADLLAGYGLLMRGHHFAYSVGPDGQDAGQFYWGHRKAFVDEIPLETGARVTLPADRVCDINTPEDWNRAEALYAKMRGKLV